MRILTLENEWIEGLLLLGSLRFVVQMLTISSSIITLLKHFMNSAPDSSQNIKVNDSLENLHHENERNSAQAPVPPKVQGQTIPPPGTKMNSIASQAATLRVEQLFNQVLVHTQSNAEKKANKRVEALFFQMMRNESLKKNCPTCNKGTDQYEERVSGVKAWLCCLMVIIIPFLVFYCQPLCDDNFKDRMYVCKECGEEKRTVKSRMF